MIDSPCTSVACSAASRARPREARCRSWGTAPPWRHRGLSRRFPGDRGRRARWRVPTRHTAAARFTAVVVFPTPPFWFTTASTVATPTSVSRGTLSDPSARINTRTKRRMNRPRFTWNIHRPERQRGHWRHAPSGASVRRVPTAHEERAQSRPVTGLITLSSSGSAGCSSSSRGRRPRTTIPDSVTRLRRRSRIDRSAPAHRATTTSNSGLSRSGFGASMNHSASGQADDRRRPPETTRAPAWTRPSTRRHSALTI